MRFDRLDWVAGHGTGWLPRQIRLADGAVISVRAGSAAYCTPRPHPIAALATAPEGYAGPYTHLEVRLYGPLVGREAWAEYNADFAPAAEAVLFGPVPVELVRALVAEHGGEHEEQPVEDDVMAGLADGYMPDLYARLLARIGH